MVEYRNARYRYILPATRASAPSRMSNRLATRSTMPPASRYPFATSTADTAHTISPTMVSTFGVRCTRWSTGTIRRAPALTQAWNLAVNIGCNLVCAGTKPRFAVHVENFIDHVAPVVQPGFPQPGLPHRAPQ